MSVISTDCSEFVPVLGDRDKKLIVRQLLQFLSSTRFIHISSNNARAVDAITDLTKVKGRVSCNGSQLSVISWHLINLPLNLTLTLL